MPAGAEPGVGWIGGDGLEQLHRAHYTDLVRLAAVLLGDRSRAEEVVQDAFVRLAARPRLLRDARQHMTGQRGNILPAFAQGRNLHGDHGDLVIKVLAECAVMNPFFQLL